MTNKSSYKLIIFIGVLGLISSYLNDGSESKSQHEAVDNVVTSWCSTSHYKKALPLSGLLCIGESDKYPSSNTYTSVVNYGSEYPVVIPRGAYQGNEYGFWINRSVPAGGAMKEIFNSSWYATIIVLYSGKGAYNFAVRVYNPTLNEYFVAKLYQLKVWKEGVGGEYKWFRSVTQANN